MGSTTGLSLLCSDSKTETFLPFLSGKVDKLLIHVLCVSITKARMKTTEPMRLDQDLARLLLRLDQDLILCQTGNCMNMITYSLL